MCTCTTGTWSWGSSVCSLPSPPPLCVCACVRLSRALPMFLVRLARRACVYVRQHKKLFIIGGLLCAGVGFGGWYVRRKLDKLKRMVARQEVRMNRLSKLLQLNDMRTAHLVKSSLQEVRQNLLQRLLDVDHLVRKARSAGMVRPCPLCVRTTPVTTLAQPQTHTHTHTHTHTRTQMLRCVNS